MTGEDKILIIEDDEGIADIVAMNLKDLGFAIEHSRDGHNGLQKALTGGYALVILDLMLPKLDGLSVCRQIREQNTFIPILMLTAKSTEIDRVLGLEIGADDYLTKPFSVRELTARVKALLRRVRAEKKSAENQNNKDSIKKDTVKFEGFFLDFDKRKVTLDGKTIELTVKEFDLLALFIHNPGRTYSRTDLLKLIWGYQYEGYDHTVNSHINRLRTKIETDPGHPRYLKTVWGIGYRFTELDELS